MQASLIDYLVLTLILRVPTFVENMKIALTFADVRRMTVDFIYHLVIGKMM